MGIKTLKELQVISDRFFVSCLLLTKSYPWAIIIVMHEYYRNLYPVDPYIPFNNIGDNTERIYKKIQELIIFLFNINQIGSYNFDFKNIEKQIDIKEQTGNIYGKLWDKFTFEQLTDKTFNILKERLEKNDFDLDWFKNKSVLDVGCGSGRYSFALRKLGCYPVVGIDYGSKGIEIAKDIVRKSKIDGMHFERGDVLSLPYPNNYFDFVFCNGVLHHTEDMRKGIEEIVRVTKSNGKIWLYLYGSGGIFWYARKEMRKVMKNIPQDYIMKVLDLIGLSSDRFIFCDNWYTPVEKHSTDIEIREILNRLEIKKITRLKNVRETDLRCDTDEEKTLYGEGELRYILEK